MGALYKLKEGWATSVLIGPFLDSYGVPITDLVIESSDVTLIKNNFVIAVKSDPSRSHHIALGYYRVYLDATDSTRSYNGWDGSLEIVVTKNGKSVRRHISVIPVT